MRILHTTFLHGYNFGGALQALAIQTLLKMRGHDVWSLDLPTSRRKLLVRKMTSRSVIINQATEGALDRFSFSNVREFDDFRSRHFQYTKPLYSLAGVAELTKDFDAYVVGSDQIWRTGWRRHQFLADLKPDQKIPRISLAACAGQFSPEDIWPDADQHAIRRFNTISVRNNFTRDSVRRYYPGTINVVCDPTVACKLLTEPYALPDEPYNLFYISNRSAGAMDLAKHVMHEVRRESIYKLFSVPPSEMKGRDLLDVDTVVSGINPLQWAYLVQQAQSVVTNSFHGVVFSVLYQRPFVALDHCSETTARAREFLTPLRLADQLARSPADAKTALQRAMTIDWETVHERIAIERNRFNDFLDSALAQIE